MNLLPIRRSPWRSDSEFGKPERFTCGFPTETKWSKARAWRLIFNLAWRNGDVCGVKTFKDVQTLFSKGAGDFWKCSSGWKTTKNWSKHMQKWESDKFSAQMSLSRVSSQSMTHRSNKEIWMPKMPPDSHLVFEAQIGTKVRIGVSHASAANWSSVFFWTVSSTLGGKRSHSSTKLAGNNRFTRYQNIPHFSTSYCSICLFCWQVMASLQLFHLFNRLGHELVPLGVGGGFAHHLDASTVGRATQSWHKRISEIYSVVPHSDMKGGFSCFLRLEKGSLYVYIQ